MPPFQRRRRLYCSALELQLLEEIKSIEIGRSRLAETIKVVFCFFLSHGGDI